MIGIWIVVGLSLVTIGLWVAGLTHRGPRHRGLRRAAGVGTALSVDGWLVALAFDGTLGPVTPLRIVAILVNAVLALGAVYSVTGVRPKSDAPAAGGGPGPGARYGSMVSRDEVARLNGQD